MVDIEVLKKIKEKYQYNADEMEWITVNGAHIPVEEDGGLGGSAGKAVEEHSAEKSGGVSQEKLNKAAEKECKRDRISYQKIDGAVHIAFNTGSFANGSTRGERAWAKVVDSSDGKRVGMYGNFEVFNTSGSGWTDQWAYECVLRK